MSTEKLSHLPNAPLAFVLALVEYNPIIDTELEKLRDVVWVGMRKHGFLNCIAQTHRHVEVNINHQTGNVTPTMKKDSERYVFAHEDKGYSIILTQSFIALQCSVYKDYKSFGHVLNVCLEVLKNGSENIIVDISKTALRYINIFALDDKASSFWFNESLLGSKLSGFEADFYHSRVERLYALDTGSLSMRVSDMPGTSPIPFGVVLDELNMSEHTASLFAKLPHPPLMLLELECFSKDKRKFNLEDFQTVFAQYNRNAERAFIECTTEQAKKQWGA